MTHWEKTRHIPHFMKIGIRAEIGISMCNRAAVKKLKGSVGWLPSTVWGTLVVMVIPIFVVLYFTSRQAVTQSLKLCLTSEVLRPNIPYTKWRGVLNHHSSLVLWNSAASVGMRSKKEECVHLVKLYKWTRAFRNSSESSHFVLLLWQCTVTVALFQAHT